MQHHQLLHNRQYTSEGTEDAEAAIAADARRRESAAIQVLKLMAVNEDFKRENKIVEVSGVFQLMNYR